MAPEIISKVQSLVSGESKSARKKKAKADTSAAAVPASPENVSSEQGATGSNAAEKVNGESENAYIKELQKNIRNINKKLNATQKVDSIIAANPGISLDDLVATRKINADQKAQAQKKPGLQAQLAQLEEQVTQYKKFDQEYQDKLAREKELMRESHAGELDELKNTLKAEAELEQKKVFREKALTLSRFLRAAAARRQLEEDDSELTKAFEGALLQVYGGDALAVTAIEKLIEGAEEGVPSTENVILSVTYSEVKRAALEEAPFAAEEAWIDEVAQSQAVPPENEGIEAVSDPTVAHAGLTELDAGEPALNSETAEASTAPAATNIEAEAANDTAKEQWDKQVAGQGELPAEPYETIPRDPAETETPHTTAAVNSTQSWADDATETSPAPAAPATGDGFHEVQHNRGGRGRGGQHQGEGRGGYRGRGRGGARGNGEYRGRGRGRGDFRGSRGGFRGAPRGESS